MAEILLAEDDESIAGAVCAALEAEAHSVRVVHDGTAALEAYGESRPDVLLLDVMMPGRNGFTVCSEIRRKDTRLPILFLTAKADEIDKVRGLSLGGDDYLAKPFGLAELVARVEALLRRARLVEPTGPTHGGALPFYIGDICVDPSIPCLTHANGERVTISLRESRTLAYFVAHANQLVTREDLLMNIWGYNAAVRDTTRVVDMLIVKLRHLLGRAASHIETCYCGGYRFVP